MRVHQFKALVLWCPDAKKALAFPTSSFSFSSSRTRRRNGSDHSFHLAWIRTALTHSLAPLALECDPPAHHRFTQPHIPSHRRDRRHRTRHKTRNITTILRHKTTTSSHTRHLTLRRHTHPLHEAPTTTAQAHRNCSGKESAGDAQNAEGLTRLGEALRLTCVVAVSYSPTTCRLQYHWRCRA